MGTETLPGQRIGMGLITAACLLPALSSADAPRAIIEEIVVTAERREATLQETAMSISAFTGESMSQRGIVNASDLNFHVPSFFYSEPGQAGITQIAIRGVGNENVTAGGDPGVAYHFDGIYLGRSGSAMADMWDIERVEVLRGPQGTLYGRNATGGSINVIPRKPGDEFEAIADVTTGNYNRIRGRFAVGGPVVEDRLMVRVSGFAEKRDGFITNLVDPSLCPSCPDQGSVDTQSIRAQLRAMVTDEVEVLATVQRFRDEGVRPFATLPLPGQRSRGQPDQPRFDDATRNPDNVRTIVKDFPEGFDLTQDIYALRLSWRRENFEVTSLTSYGEFDFRTLIDHDNSDLPIASQVWSDGAEQWLQEVQITTHLDGPWQGIAGFFFYEEDVFTDYFFQDIDVFTFMNGGKLTTRSIAPFANVSYDFSRTDTAMPLIVSAGLRWTRDEKKGSDFQMIPEFGVDLSKDIDESWSEWTWELVAQYQVQDTTMVYGSISRGYKSGGLLTGNFPGAYDPEQIIAYELGVKSNPTPRTQLNVSAFYYDYDDLQLFLLEEFGARIDNAASAEIYGIEIEALAEPVDGIQLNAQFSWLDATLEDFVTIDDIFPELGPQDLSGNRPNRAPKYTASLGAQARMSLGEWGTLTPRIDFYWQSATFLRPQNLDRDRQGSYTRTNARITWQTLDERWSAELFVENLENKNVVQNLALGAGTLGFPNNVMLYPPRLYGVRLAWQL